MEQLNYNKTSIIVLTIIFFIGVVLIVSYYLKYINYHNSIYSQIVDSSYDKNLSLISTENIIPPFAHMGALRVDNKSQLLWGAYVGDSINDLNNFENLVGQKMNYYADFESWTNSFPLKLSSSVGQSGKTLIIFWEPNFGYDQIISGREDLYIKQFALDAKKYAYPVILVPFDEMNLNEESWGYGQNNNTSVKFILAWQHVHELFRDASNVKFGIAYNNVSIPEEKGNLFSDYYPGDKYVDYVGLDGFSFSSSWKNFGDIFDNAINSLGIYNKPIILFSLAAEDSSKKALWIKEGLGSHIKNYKNVIGWIWFNKGGDHNWQINSDDNSLKAFRSILQ